MQSLKDITVLKEGEGERIKQLKIDYILSTDKQEKQALKLVIWQLLHN